MAVVSSVEQPTTPELRRFYERLAAASGDRGC